MSEQCRKIEPIELDEFLLIMREYLPGSSEEWVRSMYLKYPSAFIGYYKEGQLIGVCYGWPRSEVVPQDSSFTLDGIAIIHPYHAMGRGKKLIACFEEAVRTLKFETITVGSANGYVERFYWNCGYRPIEYKVQTLDGKMVVISLQTEDMYYNLNRNEILEREHGIGGFIVFEKRLNKP